jgi:hypothetical protein
MIEETFAQAVASIGEQCVGRPAGQAPVQPIGGDDEVESVLCAFTGEFQADTARRTGHDSHDLLLPIL